jgi:uncharacterized protein
MKVLFERRASVSTEDAEKYRDMLARHFARKVFVEAQDGVSVVNFPMGVCRMEAHADALHFHCRAETEEAVAQVAGIIASHLHLLKKLRDVPVQWVDWADGVATS